MKTELIKALKETVLDLQLDRKKYNWSEGNSCNCGLLAQNVCGMDEKTLWKNRDGGLWSWQCQKTGQDISVVMKKMFAAGLVPKDITCLENLSDENILNEAAMPADSLHDVGGVPTNTYRTNKESVIQYMQAWVRILEREDQPTTHPTQQIIHPNKPMEFIKYEEMKKEAELLFQN